MTDKSANVIPSTASVSHIFWGPVFAGVVIAAVLELTLMLLGFAIGMATVNPVTEQNPFGGLGIGTALWWIISTIVALFFGGWVSARLAGLQRNFDGFIHGLVTWGVYTLLMLYLLTTAVGAIVGGTLDVVGNVLSASGQAIGSGVQQATQAATGENGLMQEVRGQLPDLTEQEMQQVQEIATKLVQGEEIQQDDRQTLTGLLTKYTDMSQEEAGQTVQQWIQQYKQAAGQLRQQWSDVKQQAEEIGGDAANALSASAFWAFAMLLLGAIAAAVGGAVGRVKGAVTV